MRTHLTTILVIAFIILSVTSCSQEPVPPSVPLGLLTKSRDFLTFCVFLLNDESQYYNHFAVRYYYAMFSLAKINSIKKHKSTIEDSELHVDVWRVNCVEPRKEFGSSLKKVRTMCDYSPDVNDAYNKLLFDRLSPIIANERAYSKLRSDTEKNALLLIKGAEESQKENEQVCLSLLKEIDDLHTTIVNHFNK